jgi:hypothetical protein
MNSDYSGCGKNSSNSNACKNGGAKKRDGCDATNSCGSDVKKTAPSRTIAGRDNAARPERQREQRR